MSDSEWKDNFEHRVITLLQSDHFGLRESHHFGIPFVSAYQIAVAFEDHYPEICQRYGKGIGSDYKGMSNLAAYIARQLSQNIKSDVEGYPVEGVWLSGEGLADLHFWYQDEICTGKPNTEYGSYSLYRLKFVE